MKQFKRPTRVWINSPSTLQPYNKFHGKTGIAHTCENGDTTIYFSTGNYSSMIINPLYLSEKNSQSNVFGVN
jgi:hypothetical protein